VLFGGLIHVAMAEPDNKSGGPPNSVQKPHRYLLFKMVSWPILILLANSGR
jgi:hypothetical protein